MKIISCEEEEKNERFLTCRSHDGGVSLDDGTLTLPSRRMALLLSGVQRGDLFSNHVFALLCLLVASVVGRVRILMMTAVWAESSSAWPSQPRSGFSHHFLQHIHSFVYWYVSILSHIGKTTCTCCTGTLKQTCTGTKIRHFTVASDCLTVPYVETRMGFMSRVYEPCLPAA